jgi:hypothetical protein
VWRFRLTMSQETIFTHAATEVRGPFFANFIYWLCRGRTGCTPNRIQVRGVTVAA